MTDLRVSAIYTYPIKSTAGRSATRAAVEPRGLAGDRRFMVVDAHGCFMTGREHPQLTQIHAALDDDALVLESARAEPLRLPLAAQDDTGMQVVVWQDRTTGVRLGEPADRWLTELLGVECALVQMTEACRRPVDPDYSRPGDEVSYADGFPLLLIGEASLADLNARLDQPVSMRHFRPNVVVSGSEAFAEDGWRRLRIGAIEFEGAKACSRCIFTTIDPDTAEKHPRGDPLRTLSTYRRRPEGGVFFGQNLIPRATGPIHVGDPVELL